MSRYGSRMPRDFDVKAHADKLRGLFSAATGTKLSKFGNVKTGKYDSKREARRAQLLDMLRKQGLIRNLREKVLYVLIPKQDGERACTYTADFVYERVIERIAEDAALQKTKWETVVEDVKGYPNDRWAIKRKLMLFVHGVRVQEV